MRDRRNDVATHPFHVLLSAPRVLRRNDVCREQGGNEADGLRTPERFVDLEQTNLVLEIQAVPALGFDRRDTEPSHCAKPSRTAIDQRIGARAARGGHGSGDPATSRSYFLVRAPLDPRFDLICSRTRKREMRVAVDEARNDESTARVDAFVIAVLERKGLCRSDPRDVGPAPRKRRLRDRVNRVLSTLFPAGGEDADVSEY